MKRIILLGCTGSIGRNTLEIIRSRPDLFTLAGLSAHRREDELLALKDEFGNPACALSGTVGRRREFRWTGEEGLLTMIRETEADLVVNAISGSAGLLPSEAAIRSGKDLALANKESIVMAGAVISDLAERAGRKIIPVDSEHSAVFQLIQNRGRDDLEEIILTASGGPFRDASPEELARVGPEDALQHPVWNMGTKITIDSATLANKGLEVLEAHIYFQFDLDRISVLIHPEGRVHSLVRTRDGVLYAQLSEPDMKMPILSALTHPQTVSSSYGRLDLAGSTLSFFPPDTGRFPMLQLAYEAGKTGGGWPAAYNGANEAAAAAFLSGRIGFTDIAGVVRETLEADWENLVISCEQARELGLRAKKRAEKIISRLDGST